jgi:hypothetical protein
MVLSTGNKKIIDFYTKHKYLDFENINMLVVDLLEKVLHVDNLKRDDIMLNYFKEFENKFINLNSNITDIKDNMKSTTQNVLNLQAFINNMPSNVSDNLGNKLTEFKEYQVKEFEKIFELNKNKDLEKLDLKIKENIIDNVKVLIDTNMNEKTQFYLKDFETKIKDVILSSSKEMINTNNPKHVIDILDNKLSENCNKLYKVILNCHQEIKTTTTTNTETLSYVKARFDGPKSSAEKGKLSENKLENYLLEAFPDIIVKNTSSSANSCDFLLERETNSIIIENKDHKTTVSKDHVSRFIDNITEKGMHGILASQDNKIFRKNNFHIDIINKKVIVYIHNLDYNMNVIAMAINVIDNIAYNLEKLPDINTSTSVTKEILKKINNEYLNYNKKRKEKMDQLKTFYTEMKEYFDTNEFNELFNILNKEFGILKVDKQIIKCPFNGCNREFTLNKGLITHKNTCPYNPDNKDKNNVKVKTKKPKNNSKNEVMIDINHSSNDDDDESIISN